MLTQQVTQSYLLCEMSTGNFALFFVVAKTMLRFSPGFGLVFLLHFDVFLGQNLICTDGAI